MAIRRIETVAIADSAPLAHTPNDRITPLSPFAVVLAMNLTIAPPATAETMSSALVRAYGGNPDLNQQRAGVRAQDENIPRATAGWRPNVAATGQFGYNYLDARQLGGRTHGSTVPTAVGLTVTQNLFNGNRTLNSVRQAESNIFGAREDLRNTEQNVLQNGATAYMNVLREAPVQTFEINTMKRLATFRGSGRENCIPDSELGFAADGKLAEFELTFPDPMHQFNAGDGDQGAPKAFQFKHWAQAEFDRSVILLNQVVQVF